MDEIDRLPPVTHEIAVYTDQLEVKGEITAWPPRRVLDVLNNKQAPFLTVEQASIVPLSRWGKAQPTAVQDIVLNKREIVFVWPIREEKVESSEFVTVHKVPREVLAYAGSFIFQGTMHMIREANLSDAWDIIKEDFLALTNPSVFCLTVPGLTFREGPVAVLSKEKTMAIHARE